MPKIEESGDFLTLEELHPSVDLAAYYEFKEKQWYKYRVPGAHFLLIKSGEIEAVTPNGKYVAKPGDLFSFRATELNQYGMNVPTEYYEAHIQLARPPFNRSTLWLDEIGPVPVHLSLGRSFDRMRQQFETMCIDLPHSGAANRCRVVGAVWEMIEIISEVARKRPEGKHKIDNFQRARLRLSSNLNAEIEIKTLAREMGISPDHFIRRFKQRFGVSPKVWRTHARLQHAARILRAGDCSIKSLAFDLGFADAYSFTRAFKRYLGVLPSDLREGRSAAPGTSARMEGGLLKINQHIVPPHADAGWYQKFTPPRDS
jgi:AraC-like DNA-binding protein